MGVRRSERGPADTPTWDSLGGYGLGCAVSALVGGRWMDGWLGEDRRSGRRIVVLAGHLKSPSLWLWLDACEDLRPRHGGAPAPSVGAETQALDEHASETP